jgi:hypothetical protein
VAATADNTSHKRTPGCDCKCKIPGRLLQDANFYIGGGHNNMAGGVKKLKEEKVKWSNTTARASKAFALVELERPDKDYTSEEIKTMPGILASLAHQRLEGSKAATTYGSQSRTLRNQRIQHGMTMMSRGFDTDEISS